MLALSIVALVVSLVALAGAVVVYLKVLEHYRYWDLITDRIILQTRDVVSNHNGRICELELSLGGIYTPFGYKKTGKE